MRWKIIAAYVAVYLAWGSTYLGIRIGVAHFSPAGLCGLRFLLAGALLAALRIAAGKGRLKISRAELLRAAAIGCVMLAAGTGLLCYAELTVPSGVCALVIGCAPIVFAVLNRMAGGPPLTRYQVAGGVLGLAGLASLTWHGSAGEDQAIALSGLGLVAIGMFCWVGASVVSQHIRLPDDHYLAASIEMLAAGVFLVIVGRLRGEFAWRDLVAVPREAMGAIVYLAIVGSCLGFTAYSWLLRHEPANRVSSYAFVNPVVAVFLGVFFAGEPFTRPIAVAVMTTLAGVSLSLFGGRWNRRREPIGLKS